MVPTDAYELALRKLKSADRFEAELRNLLSEADDTVVDQVIGRLRQHGIVNDDRLAANLVAANQGRSTVGRSRLREELCERGAPPESVEAALLELPDEVERACDLLRTRPSGPQARLGRFLFSRGFDEDTIDSALDKYAEASE